MNLLDYLQPDTFSRIRPQKPVTDADIASSIGSSPTSMSTSGAPAPASSPEPASPGGQQFARIVMSRVPGVDMNPPRTPAPYSDPNEPLPVRPSPVASSTIPRISSLYGDYGEPGPQQRHLSQIEAANLENKGRGDTVHTGGFWDRLKDAGLLALHGLGVGGGGGAIGGFLRGIFDPQYLHEVRYNEKTLPRAQRAAAAEAKQQDETMNRIGKIAAETGTLPSGEPTETARYRMANDARTRLNQAQIDADRDERNRQGAERIGQRDLEDWERYHPGEPYPDAITKARPYLAGKTAPEKTTGSGVPHFVPETGGRMIWDPKQGKMVPTPGSEALGPKVDYNKLNYELSQKRFGEEEKQHTLGRHKEVFAKGGLKDEFEKVKEETTNLEREAREMTAAVGAGGAFYGKGHPQEGKPIPNAGIYKGKVITADDAKAKYDERDAANTKLQGIADNIRHEYGDVADVSSDGTAVRPKAAAAAKTSAPSSAGTTKAPANQSVSAAIERYKDYVSRHPEHRERERQRFMAANPGVDPEK